MNGLPTRATLFGAFEFPLFEPLTLDDAGMRRVLPLFVPRETADRLTPENLGRLRISRVALAYYEGGKTKDARVIVHLSGVALDGHARIVEFLRNAGDKVQVEELDGRLGANGPVCVSSSERPFALKIVDDNDAYLAVSLNRDAGARQARKLLEKVPSSAWISAGYNPPWVRQAVPNRQADACGFLLGEIPAPWQKRLTETLNLRACPRTFSCRMRREGGGIALYLTLNMGRAEAARLLRDDLEKGCLQGLDRLQARFPGLRQEPQALAHVRQTLKRMRWTTHGDSVQTQVQLSGPTWASLLALVQRAFA